MDALVSDSLLVNVAIFAAAACAVWFAGTRLVGYVDQLAQRFDLGEAAVGILLLATVTSLPEIATTLSAASTDNAPLAVNNLLGSIVMQIALLALADLVFHKRALTSVVPDPVVMLQGALNVCLLAVVALAALAGDVLVLGAGLWTWALLAGGIYSFWKISEAEGNQPWIANVPEEERPRVGEHSVQRTDATTRGLVARALACAAIILAAGYVLAISGEAVAQQSGLGSSFMGAAFVALATSLPEASTVFASLRRGRYTMAISDILGTNILNVVLLFGIDAIVSGEPVLRSVGPFPAILAILGVLMTGLFQMGLTERSDRTIGRMGVDSAAVLVVYAGGLALLYSMRGSA